ncbi:MAG: hypothetical protein JRH15_17455 [Deltaproteobacteria bacterium]|nr:hypothetical protein [Deltaproteobacteria bacterium]
MMKVFMTLILVILISLTAGHVSGGEMAKEGSDSGTTYATSTAQVLALGEEYVQINYDVRGVYATDNEASPFFEATCQCVGAMKEMKDEITDSALCIFTRPDKDKIFMSYDGKGWGVPGDLILVGGTGKCAGITGNGKITITKLQGPAEGVGAHISKSTVNWKMP